jgi:catechol 2,3-dioxygenase-like lactoylglutathione lyase family enzyme
MKIEHVAINVPDARETAAWYAEHLGLKIVRKVDQPPYMHFLADESGQSMLEIYANTEAGIPDYPAMHPQNLHIAFVVDDIESELNRLLAAGATPEGGINPTPAGDKLVFFRDPWGVPLQLVQRKTPMM